MSCCPIIPCGRPVIGSRFLPSLASRAARRARLVWCFRPCVCARYEPSFWWTVRQRRHSKEPTWLRKLCGRVNIPPWRRVRKEGDIQVGVFFEVDGFQRKLAETFTAVLVGRGVRGHATSAHFRADTSFVCHGCDALLLLLLLLGVDGSRGCSGGAEERWWWWRVGRGRTCFGAQGLRQNDKLHR
jgi:hypothetical protein